MDERIQRYFLAKYTRDLRRNEPVNIGIVLWCDGRVGSKFITSKEAKRLVESVPTFNRWVEWWTRLLDQDAIEPHRGNLVPKTSATFLEAVATEGRGNYSLEYGGDILDPVTATKLPVAVDQLFQELVARKPLRVNIHKRNKQCASQ